MIFATVGAQMPFDRMISALDLWAERTGRTDVFAQIGPTDLKPRHIEWTRFLEPQEFLERYRRATLIVAHAGTGSILQALELGKPVVVMPRRAAKRETRNDHQVATARRFIEKGVPVAWDEHELGRVIERALSETSGFAHVGPWAEPRLIARLRSFIDQEG